MMRTNLKALAFGLGLLLVAAVAMAATTGGLRGQVTDGQGAPLPGVTITLTSANVLGGPWVRVTDADGMYQFPALQPGTYDVQFALEGFATRERPDVRVLLDSTQQVNAQMSLSTVEEEIVVTAEAPVVDPDQVGTQQVFTNEYLNKAALGSANRSYQSVLTQSAGVTGGANPNVYGATSGENAFLIDGVTTTDPVTSTFGTNFNFDAIQEIAFNTGGFEAEYGGATGGIVNVITKSGGNTFNGNVDVRYRDSDFFEEGDFFDPDEQQTEFLNPGATLGGPILRDRLWFFTAYEFTNSENTPSGSPTTRDFEAEYILGKLTYQISDSWRLVGKYSTDPADIANANASRSISPEATRFQEQGGDLFSGSLDGILTPSLIWDFKVGINRQDLNSFPQSGNIDGPPAHFNDATGQWTGNYNNAQFSNRDRDEYRTTLTWFVDQLGGSHEFKVGGEYNDMLFSASNNTTAGGFYYQDLNGPQILWFSPVTGASETDGNYQAVFAQDAWRITPRITAKLGVRYDQVDFTNDVGTEVADLSKVQPRLGLAWDLTGNARTVFRASAGRFMHPSALTLPFYARQDAAPTVAYLSCTTFGIGPSCEDRFGGTISVGGYDFPTWIMDPDNTDPNGFLLVPGNIFSSEPSQVHEDLNPMYTEEVILGVEHAFAPRTSVELTYVDREWNDIFEDTCVGNFPTPSAGANCDFYLFANLPQLQRDYTAYIVRMETRDIERLHLVASYTNADSRGSVGYTQNAGADFDIFPDHFVNRYGRDEPEHSVKLNGYVDLPLEFTVGFDAFWRSEFFWTPTIPGPTAGYGTQFVEPRGSREGEDIWQLDLELSKYLTFGDVRARLIGTVFNVTSEEAPNAFCANFSGTCSGIAFGEATSWQQPRRYEVGFRLEF